MGQSNDVNWKRSVIEAAIRERRDKLRFYAILLGGIWLVALVLIVFGSTIDKQLLPWFEAFGGTKLASTLVASIGSVPSLRECLDQWSGIHGLEDIRNGYVEGISEDSEKKLDELFWHLIGQRAGVTP